ncbi:MAG: sulfotransferase [Phenylobacterium sp.]|nr:sulfotransferase [Phenylobacterium sp.]
MSAERPSPSHPPLLIHVGYHKTGTTWFQRELFQPAYGYNPLMSHEEVFQTLVKPHALTFDGPAAMALLESRRRRGAPGSVDVISSEILVGNPFYGGRESDDYARRLKAMAPAAKILLTTREQIRAMTSVYMQYLLRGGTQTPAAFFADAPVMGYFAFAPEHFEYHRLVEFYGSLFGPENVLVLTQEALASDPMGLTRQLAAFAGMTATVDETTLSTRPVSPSPPESVAPILRRINHFRSGPAGLGPVVDLGPLGRTLYRAASAFGRSGPIKSALKSYRPVTRVVSDLYGGRFGESNRRLKAFLGDSVSLPGYES